MLFIYLFFCFDSTEKWALNSPSAQFMHVAIVSLIDDKTQPRSGCRFFGRVNRGQGWSLKSGWKSWRHLLTLHLGQFRETEREREKREEFWKVLWNFFCLFFLFFFFHYEKCLTQLVCRFNYSRASISRRIIRSWELGCRLNCVFMRGNFSCSRLKLRILIFNGERDREWEFLFQLSDSHLRIFIYFGISRLVRKKLFVKRQRKERKENNSF